MPTQHYSEEQFRAAVDDCTCELASEIRLHCTSCLNCHDYFRKLSEVQFSKLEITALELKAKRWWSYRKGDHE